MSSVHPRSLMPRDKLGYEFVYQYPPPRCLPECRQELLADVNGPPGASVGIYIHIPFCRSICAFCHYARSVPSSESEVSRYLVALEAELDLACETLSLGAAAVGTVHFGGGTPTYLTSEQIRRLSTAITGRLRIAPQAEITWESTPDSIDAGKCEVLAESGCNRISIGAQCFDPDILSACNRPHTSAQVEQACSAASSVGIRNINMDLIFGLPGQTNAIWMATVHRAVDLGATSLTLYHLRIKRGTPIASLPLAAFPTEEECDEMYLAARSKILETGYVQSAPSCFVFPGDMVYRHQYDKAKGGDYVGLGLSAYSYCRRRLFFNTRDPQEYYTSIEERRLPLTCGKALDDDEMIRRLLIVGLRYSDGASLRSFHDLHSVPSGVASSLAQLVGAGFAEWHDDEIRLTEAGILRADEVCASLYSEHYTHRLKEMCASTGAYFDMEKALAKAK